jgi:hypothetical protein
LSLPQAAQPSNGAPRGNRATQSSSGSSPHVTQPPRHRDQPSSQLHGNIRSGNTRNNTNFVATNNLNNARNDAATNSDDGDISDASNAAADANVQVRRRSNTNTAPHPTQLHFYSGCWVDVLKDAKYHYRLHVHAEEAFPERSRDSLAAAHDCLVEAVAKFQAQVRLELDDGSLQCIFIGNEMTNCFVDIYKAHCSDMDILVSGF